MPQFTDLTYMGGTRSCGPIYPIFNTDRPMADGSLVAKFEVRSSLLSDAIVITTEGRTYQHSSNVLKFRADQMSPSNLGSQIDISRCHTRIDKINIRSMRRYTKKRLSRRIDI